jgi:molecular chaperone GrpE (heat shock protein)
MAKEKTQQTKSGIAEKLENLKAQLSQIETTYAKVQGAIEFCQALLEEEIQESLKENKKGK